MKRRRSDGGCDKNLQLFDQERVQASRCPLFTRPVGIFEAEASNEYSGAAAKIFSIFVCFWCQM
jgi:hypothetical protein